MLNFPKKISKEFIDLENRTLVQKEIQNIHKRIIETNQKPLSLTMYPNTEIYNPITQEIVKQGKVYCLRSKDKSGTTHYHIIGIWS